MKILSMTSNQEMTSKSYMKKLEANCHQLLNIMKIVVRINGRADEKHLSSPKVKLYLVFSNYTNHQRCTSPIPSLRVEA